MQICQPGQFNEPYTDKSDIGVGEAWKWTKLTNSAVVPLYHGIRVALAELSDFQSDLKYFSLQSG